MFSISAAVFCAGALALTRFTAAAVTARTSGWYFATADVCPAFRFNVEVFAVTSTPANSMFACASVVAVYCHICRTAVRKLECLFLSIRHRDQHEKCQKYKKLHFCSAIRPNWNEVLHWISATFKKCFYRWKQNVDTFIPNAHMRQFPREFWHSFKKIIVSGHEDLQSSVINWKIFNFYHTFIKFSKISPIDFEFHP